MKNKRKFWTYFYPVLCLLWIPFTVNAQNWMNTARYAKQNQKLMEDKITPDVVFIGNSITEAWANNYPDFFANNNYEGRGISGQTTPQFLLRFRHDVINLHPKIVVINGGINDIAENTGPYDHDVTFSHIQSMAELAMSNNIKVILTSVMPASGIPWRLDIKNTPDKIIALNNSIREYARQKNIPYLDYYASMVDEKNEKKAMIADYTTDGVHVTEAGYKVMEKLVKQMIDKVLAGN